MTVKTHEITVDINTLYTGVVEVNQNNNNADELIITVTNDGKAYDLTGLTVRFAASKPDGTTIYDNIAETDVTSNKVIVYLTQNMTAANGFMVCELQFFEDKNLVSTAVMNIHIRASAIGKGEGVTSSNEFGALIDALAEIDTATESAETAALAANTAATNADTAREELTEEVDNKIAEVNADITTWNGKVNTAVTNAKEATSNANTAAENADTAREELTETVDNKIAEVNGKVVSWNSSVETAVTNAQTATSNATSAANAANNSASKADTATSKANTAATNADTARTNLTTTVNNKITEVNTEVDNKISEVDKKVTTWNSSVTTAVNNANTATASANTAATNATTQADYAKEQGEYAKAQGDAIDSKVEAEATVRAEEDSKTRHSLAYTEERLENVINELKGISYREVVDESLAQSKSVATNSTSGVLYTDGVEKFAEMGYLGGKSQKFNQLQVNGGFDTQGYWGADSKSSISVSNNILTFTATAQGGSFNSGWSGRIITTANHKYLTIAKIKLTTPTNLIRFSEQARGAVASVVSAESTNWQYLTIFSTESNNSYYIFGLTDARESGWDAVQVSSITCYDLTVIYGAGNEPSTVDEFKADFPLDYYAYDAGSIKSAEVDKITGTGKNLVNKAETVNGKWITNQGEEASASSDYYLTPYIKIDGGTNYYFGERMSSRTMFYDISKKVINAGSWGTAGSSTEVFKTPTDAAYVRITIGVSSLETFQLIKSDSIVSTYYPYTSKTSTLPTAITSLDGYGLSVSDTIYNYVDFDNKKFHKKVGSVDLGTLTWKYYSDEGIMYSPKNTEMKKNGMLICVKYARASSWESCKGTDKTAWVSWTYADYTLNIHDSDYTDASAFKTAMSGVMLYYELATEETIDLSDILDDDFDLLEVEGGGTIDFHYPEFDNGFVLNMPSKITYDVDISQFN